MQFKLRSLLNLIPLFIFCMIGFLTIFFREQIRSFVFSKWYGGINYFIFYISLFYLVIILGVYITKSLKNTSKNNKFQLLIVFVISSLYMGYYAFFLSGKMYGRIMLLDMLIDNYNYITSSGRSYFGAFGLLYRFILSKPLTAIGVLNINRFLSLCLVIVVFLMAYYFFKNYVLSFFCTVFFMMSPYITSNIISIEHNLSAVFFTVLSIYLLLKHGNKKQFLVASMASMLMASLCRFELSFLFGAVYLIYISLFYIKNNLKIILAFSLVLGFRAISIFSHLLHHKDLFLTGNMDGEGIKALLSDSYSILYNNLIINNDLSIFHGSATIFTFLGVFLSFIFIIHFIRYCSKKKTLIKYPHKSILIFAFYNVIYLFFQLSFHIEGLRSGFKYSVQYWICEIMLFTYSYIVFLEPKLYLKWIKLVGRIVFILVTIFILSIFFKGSFDYDDKTPDITYTYVSDVLSVDLDSKCYIIKTNRAMPYYDKIHGLSSRALHLDYNEGVLSRIKGSVYSKIKGYIKPGNCYYFLDIYYFGDAGEFWYTDSGVEPNLTYHLLDPGKVDQSFENCDKSLVGTFWENSDFTRYANGPNGDALFRYDC